MWHEGEITIDCIVKPQEKSIPQGQRNSTMSHFAGRVVKRYGATEKAHQIFMEEADKCDPPLPDEELASIWQSACRFAEKVQSQEGYVSPEDYNGEFCRESLKPADYSDIGQAKVLAKEYGVELRYTADTDYIRFWAEFKLLDMGRRLGRFIGQYRTRFFLPDKRNGQVVFSYKPLPGAEEKIYRLISDITFSMKSTDYLQMPQFVSSGYEVYLSEEEVQRYVSFKASKTEPQEANVGLTVEIPLDKVSLGNLTKLLEAKGSSTTTNSAGGHTHNIGRDTDGGAGSSRYTVHSAGTSGAQATSPTSSAGAHTHSLTPKGKNANTGGGGSHTNLQPYIVCYMWKRTA